MLREEILILNYIINSGTPFTYYQIFHHMKRYLNVSHFKSVKARKIWSTLEYLYRNKLSFDEKHFEIGLLNEIGLYSYPVANIRPQIELIRRMYESK